MASKLVMNMEKVVVGKNPEPFGQNGSYKFYVYANYGNDKNGNKKESDTIEVVVFNGGNKAAYYCAPDANGNSKIKKGMTLNIAGTPDFGSYEKNGVTVPTFKVILEDATPIGTWNAGSAGNTAAPAQEAAPATNFGDDDMPFN